MGRPIVGAADIGALKEVHTTDVVGQQATDGDHRCPAPGAEHEVRGMLGDGVVRAAATALHLLEHKYRRITGGGGPEVVSSLPAGPMQLAGDS